MQEIATEGGFFGIELERHRPASNGFDFLQQADHG
jgi:hypothetical protein